MSFEIVFIGETNDGKTTIVSSLVEDEDAIISPLPGTTKVAHQHQLHDRSGKVILNVWDTPGFEETDDLHAWFASHANESAGNLAAKFVELHAGEDRWRRDTELLRPLSTGALVVYVAASNRKPQSTDLKQVEIVRLAGANRIALINQKPGKDYTQAWKDVLTREIGIVRTYSPLTAGIRQRLELLDKLADCTETHEKSIQAARQALQQDWEDRLEDLARMMLDAVYQTAKASAFSTKSQTHAEQKLGKKLESIELRFQERARKLFHHQNLRIESPFFNAELHVTETWKILGLGISRGNAVWWGGMAGSATGLIIDTTTVGWAFGIPTLVGGLAGATLAGAYVYTPFGQGKLSQKGFEAVVETRSQVLSVLLDRMIIYARCMLRVSHGDRTSEAIRAETEVSQGQRLSFVDAWDKSALKAWATLAGRMKSHASLQAVEDKDPEAYEALIQTIVADLDSSSG